MEFTNDPNDDYRRRIDAEGQRRRDRQVAELRRAGVSYRAIARRCGSPEGATRIRCEIARIAGSIRAHSR